MHRWSGEALAKSDHADLRRAEQSTLRKSAGSAGDNAEILREIPSFNLQLKFNFKRPCCFANVEFVASRVKQFQPSTHVFQTNSSGFGGAFLFRVEYRHTKYISRSGQADPDLIPAAVGDVFEGVFNKRNQ